MSIKWWATVSQIKNKGRSTSDKGKNKDEKKKGMLRNDTFHMAVDYMKGRELERETEARSQNLLFVFLWVVGAFKSVK